MPDGVNQKIGDNKEVRASFKEWDPRQVPQLDHLGCPGLILTKYRLDKMLEYVDQVLEWRVRLSRPCTLSSLC
jgi:salicylate hydroxylase